MEEPTSTSDLTVMIQDYLKNESPSNSLIQGIVRCLVEYLMSVPWCVRWVRRSTDLFSVRERFTLSVLEQISCSVSALRSNVSIVLQQS